VVGLCASIAVAVFAIGMPAGLALRAALLGAAYGLFPIGWILLNVIFLYRLTVEQGAFEVLHRGIGQLTADKRLQLVLIAFAFGAFFEGAAGFGTPVAVTAALLIGLGFAPLEASGLSLIANTAPVAFGALGTPLIALQGVTGLDLHELSAQVGRQLPVFSVMIPFWLVAYSTFHEPWRVIAGTAFCSMLAFTLFLLVWQPPGAKPDALAGQLQIPRAAMLRACAPWALLCVIVFAWGTPQVKSWLDSISALKIPVQGLHLQVLSVPPVVTAPTPEPAVFLLNWLSASGSGIALTALIAGVVMGCKPAQMARAYAGTLRRIGPSLLTIAAMMALGYVTRYSGTDAVLGIAFAHAGVLYPFFGTFLGWLGVALTGSDTASNVLFGGLQVVTARQVGVSPVLMAAANSSGGVMGKMIDAQSIVVAGTATQMHGQEGAILRYVFRHSLALVTLVGLWVMLQAYVF
jgi:lactate permease